jgi:hypothetical protein
LLMRIGCPYTGTVSFRLRMCAARHWPIIMVTKRKNHLDT